jgi:hypothetical protein
MAQSPELLAQLSIWRSKSLDGTMTVDDMREAIIALRDGRVSACFASKAARVKVVKNPLPSAEDLLEKLSEYISCL